MEQNEQKIGPHEKFDHELLKVSVKKDRDNTLAGSILIAAILISGSIIYLVGAMKGGGGIIADPGNSPEVTPSNGLAISERDVVLGNPKAPVTLIEYGDYQCPFCARFYSQTESQIRTNYIEAGKVKMVFRNLQFLGPESVAAAEAAECAKDQNQFWAYHDALYEEELRDATEHNGNLNRELFVSLARNLKLNESQFAQCVDGKKYAELIQQDLGAAQLAGVNTTPTSFVNGTPIQGAQPYAIFQAAIDKALAGN